MKIIILIEEVMDIIKQYYENKGIEIKDLSFNLEKIGMVRNIKFKGEIIFKQEIFIVVLVNKILDKQR